VREYNFDGLVGPTHNYAGLSRGNLASERHAGRTASPRRAALEGLAKMRFLASLGVGQAVLLPQPRPDIDALRRLGFHGSDADVLERAGRGDGHLLRLASSASSMWTANAATVAPSTDTSDARLHITVANLSSMFHRSLEAPVTLAVLRAIFADSSKFAVHEPLLGGAHFADEGAANHIRLEVDARVAHLFAWGRSAWQPDGEPARYPRRQTREASEAVARANRIRESAVLLWQQDGAGIDAGAFHTDVLATGSDAFLMMHERAFVHHRDLLRELGKRFGDGLDVVIASEGELAAGEAAAAYPFNSQIVTLTDGTMAIVAPTESRESPTARAFLERVVAENNPVRVVHYVDVNASMNNGGGPACLRLRIRMSDAERGAVAARVFFDDALDRDLVGWVERHYRDRLDGADLADPALLDEVRTALDELTRIVGVGSIYDFQRP
jgi:succinylarginine dihydrolase